MAKIDGQKALAHLREKWRGQHCTMCKVGKWNVNELTFQLLEYHEGSLAVGGPVIPVIPVTCTNCGNTVLVNAMIAGVLDGESGEKP